MNKRFMGTKKGIAFVAISVMLISTQLCGCSSALIKDMRGMVEKGVQVELSVDTPEDKEQGTPVLDDWKPLAELEDQEDLRDTIDDQLKIIPFGGSKNGVIYVNPKTKEWEPNNTLENSFKNKKFTEYWEDAEVQSEIQKEVKNTYIDVEDLGKEELKLVALNSYYNLFADDEEAGYYNGDSTLTRADFMTGLARASEKADDKAKVKKELKKALGDNKEAIYAGYVIDNSYLDIKSGSLDKDTFNSTMTRAEAVYMVVSKYYSKELKKEEDKGETYEDCKNAGDIISEAGADKAKFNKSIALKAMLDNPTKGIEEELYKALKIAYEHNLLTKDGELESESRWNEGITKSEAIQLLVNVYKDLGTECNSDRGRSEAKEEKDNTEAKEEKQEKKWLTKEEFAKATGLDKEPEEALNDQYVAYSELFNDPDEALEAVKENIAYNKASGGWEQLYGDGNQVVDNSDGTNSQTTTSDNNTSSDVASDQQAESQTNSNQPANTQDNTTVYEESQDESGISHEEAERIAAEFNHGNTGFQKGLTPEQEQREIEAWSEFSAQ